MRSTSRTVVVIIALALAAGACGDDDAASTTDAITEDTVAPITEDTATTTIAPTTTAATATSSESAEAGPDVGELLARYEMTPLRTTYLLGEGDDQTEIVLAQDPTANPPIESVTIIEADTKIIISEGTTILCEGSTNMCFEVPGAAGESLTTGLLGPFGSLLAMGRDGPLGAAITEEPITVAGRNGVCLTYVPPVGLEGEADQFRQCIDSELGFTLLLQVSATTPGAVETVMELIDFSQPTSEDFEPTGPVTPAG